MKTESNVITTPKAEDTAYKCAVGRLGRQPMACQEHDSNVTNVN